MFLQQNKAFCTCARAPHAFFKHFLSERIEHVVILQNGGALFGMGRWQQVFLIFGNRIEYFFFLVS